MLKIKDNVDLKELEKFGFHIGYKSHFIHTKDTEPDDNIRITNKRIVQIGFAPNLWMCGDDYYSNGYLDTIYDLIKADIIEKEDG